MYEDILGKKKEKPEPVSQEEVMEAMSYNIKKKQKIIDDLVKRITELERQLENTNQHTHAGI